MRVLIAAVLTAATVGSSDVLAQMPGGAGDSPGGGTHRRPEPGRPTQAPDKTVDRSTAEDAGAPVQVQLDRLEDDLKLSASQRKAWNAYCDKVLSFSDDMTRARFTARTSSIPKDATALQQLIQLTDKARSRLTAIEDIAESGKALYALLTPEQRAMADETLVLPMLWLANGLPPTAIGARGR